MKKRKAIVTGAAGQDGFYMCKFLYEKGYEVYAIDKKYETNQYVKLFSILDVTDNTTLYLALDEIEPDEIYNFAGISDNLEAFEKPYDLLDANVKPVITILSYLKWHPTCKFFQASSSLIFGDSCEETDGFQHVSTAKEPTTPYGCSKLYAYNMINTYRKHYGVFAVNGILYNHESPRRREYFLIPKIVKGAVECSKDKTKKLKIGDKNATRDWSHASDIVEVAYKSLQYKEAKDWIMCSNRMSTVEYILYYVFDKLGMDYRDHVEIDPTLINNKQENNHPGNSTYTKLHLNWEPKVSLENLLNEMIEHYKNK